MKKKYYFPHFEDARNDQKIKRLRIALGLEGYAIYFMLLEVLRNENDYKYLLEDADLLADDFKTSQEKIKDVVLNYGLFKVDKKGYFFSVKFIENMQPYEKMVHQRRKAAEKSWENRRRLVPDTVIIKGNEECDRNATAMQPQCDRNATAMQTKLNEIKLNEIKVNKSKLDNSILTKEKEKKEKEISPPNFSLGKQNLKKEKKFIPPTLEEFTAYGKEKFPEIELWRFENKFKIWEASNWINGRTNKKISNWKTSLAHSTPYMIVEQKKLENEKSTNYQPKPVKVSATYNRSQAISEAQALSGKRD